MIAGIVVMFDEGRDLPRKVTEEIVVFDQNEVLQGLVPTLDLARCLR